MYEVFRTFDKTCTYAQVVGALLAGLLLGPAVFKIIPQTEFLTQTAEVGVVILMFCAGMETDVKELKKCGKAATLSP